jgi:hypothetical protein
LSKPESLKIVVFSPGDPSGSSVTEPSVSPPVMMGASLVPVMTTETVVVALSPVPSET